MNGPKPPYLNFTVEIIYKSLVSKKRYRYVGHVTLMETCELPNQKGFAVGGESIVEFYGPWEFSEGSGKIAEILATYSYF